MKSSSLRLRLILRSILVTTLTLKVVVVAAAGSRGATRNDGNGVGDTSRIVGGEQADPGDYPYFVEMGGCGGALIAPDIVLFAAHCTDGRLNQQINIGAYRTRSDEGGAQPRFCDEWIADPDYTENPPDSDFALCKLDRPVDVSGNEKRVFLELNNRDTVPADGEDLLVMGLGRTSPGGATPTYLRDVTVPALSNAECNNENHYGGVITDRMLCAGYPETGGKDSCQGDSGGPIVRRKTHSDGRIVDTHVGVVSWGVGCASENYPGVYARTSSRYGWIVETMCGMGSIAPVCKDYNPGYESLPSLGEAFSCGGGGSGQQEQQQQLQLTISLTTDVYGSETAWLLTDKDGNRIKHRKYFVNEHKYDSHICVEPDTCYNWQIRDSYGDGMCTTAGGCGSYTFTLRGEEIITGDGNFGDARFEEFCTGAGTEPPQTEEPETTDPPFTEAPTDAVSNGCGGSGSAVDLGFSVQVRTDDHGADNVVVLYALQEDFSNLGDLLLKYESLESNTLHTLPGDGEGEGENGHLCLEDNRCFLFAITDVRGNGMTEGDTQGFFRGFLGGEEVFFGTGDFSDYDDRVFCTGTAEPPPPTGVVVVAVTDAPTPGPSAPPTASPTTPPTAPPTASPTTPPTASPTGSPTAPPTASPVTPPPTPPPTATPGVLCEDDEGFRYKGRKRWTCKNFLKGRNQRRVANKCKKRVKKKRVYDFCPETCGRKVGVGPCAHLKPSKKASGGNTLTTATVRAESKGGPTKAATPAAALVKKTGTPTERTESTTTGRLGNNNNNNNNNMNNNNVFTTNNTNPISTNRSGDNNSETWLNFENQMNRRRNTAAEDPSERAGHGDGE